MEQSLPNHQVNVTIPFVYNFCPTTITTTMGVHSFTLTQGAHQVVQQSPLDTVNSTTPINGAIVLDVTSKVEGSVLYFAKITSLRIYESHPNTSTSLPYLDITNVATIGSGFCLSSTLNEIEVPYFSDRTSSSR